jgi:hypothetical protein
VRLFPELLGEQERALGMALPRWAMALKEVREMSRKGSRIWENGNLKENGF